MRSLKRSPFTPRRDWLKVLVSMFVLVTLGSGCERPTPKDKVSSTEQITLPTEIQSALERASKVYTEPLKDVAWSKCERLRGDEHSLYQLRGTNARRRTVELEITKGGRVIEVEELGIPLSEVPGEVMEGLKTKLPFANPDWIIAIYQSGSSKPVSYGFGGHDSAGKSVEVYISADGKTILN
jgi:hypothetical protein